MDAVILAAGKGERLDGITAPYHKPLLVVNGQSLISQSVRHALRFANRVVIVVAPENALPITQVLGLLSVSAIDIIVQPKPTGPGDALRRALRLCTQDETLVLMADNLLHADDVEKIAKAEDTNVIGVRTVYPSPDNERFTRYQPVHKVWVEKIPFNEDEQKAEALVWVGPIKVSTVEMRTALMLDRHIMESGEIPIGPYFNDLTDVKVEKVDAFDIGVPEALV